MGRWYYPWFSLSDLSVEARPCPDSAQEARFLNTLSGMSLVEVLGPSLILTDPAGREMVFIARD